MSALGCTPAEAGDRLSFEMLISDLSRNLVTAPDDAFPSAAKEALRQVVEFFGGERGGILHVEPGRRKVSLLHAWYADALQSRLPAALNFAEILPRAYALMVEQGRPNILATLGELPPEAARDRETYAAMGVKSALGIPIRIGPDVRYIISVQSLAREVRWPDSFVPRLQLLGEVLANTLERRRVGQALSRQQAQLSLAMLSAGAGPWDLDLDSGRVWATREAKELYGLPPGGDVNLDAFLAVVHPDDVDRVRRQVEEAAAGNSEFSDEYRVVLPGGAVRWIAARGRVHQAPGEAGRHMMGVSSDATVRKLAEHERRQSAARLQAAIDVASLGFYVVANGERVTYVDERCRSLFGMTEDQAAGTAGVAFWMAHLHPDEVARMVEVHTELNAGSEDRVSVEYRFNHPARGQVWLHQVTHVLERHADGRARTTIGVVRDVTDQKHREEALARALADVQRLREQLEHENIYLRQEATTLRQRGPIVGRSPAMRRAMTAVEQVAATDSTVLLLGETGTGKELFATALHDLSARRGRTMVRVNCAAIPVTLIESELFGRERGAYTGALSRQVGRFEMADGSTIFLDEIGDLPMDIQVKLLRVLQERQIERLGSPRPISVDLRIIAATNHDLERDVREGRFREDLYYRLNVFPVRVPPLRERSEDLPLLVEALASELAGRMGKRIDSVSRASLEKVRKYHWPGNVRELRNAIERSMILAAGPVLDIEVPGADRPAIDPPSRPGPAGMDREALLAVLERSGWRIRGRNGAAEQLGLKPTTLEARMAKLGIKRP